MPDIREHRRVLDTITASVERRTLQWLAARMPGWSSPDLLTGVGVVGGLIVFLGYWLSGVNSGFLWLASLGFAINWFGDSLDGTLARYRHIERPTYGFYIDHAVDTYIVILIFLGLGLSPYVRFDVACLALIAYLLLEVLVYLRTCARGEFVISYGRLGPTEVRIIAVLANTLVFFVGNPQVAVFSVRLTVYDWMTIGVTVTLALIALATTLRQAKLLSDQDRRMRQEKKTAAGKLPLGGNIASQD